jgi:hypothetical protein
MATCLKYLDAVGRPFDYHLEPRPPAGLPPTINLTDYFDDNTLYTPITQGSTPSIIGVGFTMSYGYNSMRAISYSQSAGTISPYTVYGPVWFYIQSDGTILSLAAVAGPLTKDKVVSEPLINKFKCHDDIKRKLPQGELKRTSGFELEDMDDVKEPSVGVNYTASFYMRNCVNISTILGSANGINGESALITSLRIISGGIRLLPTIELITDSDTFAVSKFYGFTATPIMLTNLLTDGGSIFTLARSCPDYEEYPNEAGVTGRLQPYQDQILNLAKMNNLQVYTSQSDSEQDTDNFYFPVLLARFTSALTLSASATINLPVRPYFRTLLEGPLVQPSPITTTDTPFDPTWETQIQMFQHDRDNYPVIVKGHSFDQVKKLYNAIGSGVKLVQQLSSLKDDLNNMRRIVNQQSQLQRQPRNKNKAKPKSKKEVLKVVVKPRVRQRGPSQQQIAQRKKNVNAYNAYRNRAMNDAFSNINPESSSVLVDALRKYKPAQRGRRRY